MFIDGALGRRFRLRGAPIIHDTIDSETIAINQRTGAYYSLEGPAALVWTLLGEGATAAEISRRLEARYVNDGASLEASVAEFLDELLAEELIVAGDDVGADAPAAAGDDASVGDGSRATFPGLRLQRYTDLEVMLLADPIHEVDDTGWPMPLADKPR